jgi:hypothetical protein
MNLHVLRNSTGFWAAAISDVLLVYVFSAFYGDFLQHGWNYCIIFS